MIGDEKNRTTAPHSATAPSSVPSIKARLAILDLPLADVLSGDQNASLDLAAWTLSLTHGTTVLDVTRTTVGDLWERLTTLSRAHAPAAAIVLVDGQHDASNAVAVVTPRTLLAYVAHELLESAQGARRANAARAGHANLAAGGGWGPFAVPSSADLQAMLADVAARPAVSLVHSVAGHASARHSRAVSPCPFVPVAHLSAALPVRAVIDRIAAHRDDVVLVTVGTSTVAVPPLAALAAEITAGALQGDTGAATAASVVGAAALADASIDVVSAIGFAGRTGGAAGQAGTLHTVPAHAPVLEAMRVLWYDEVRLLGVNSSSDPAIIADIISVTDVVAVGKETAALLSPIASLAAAGHRHPLTVRGDSSIADAARHMLDHGVHQLVVITGDEGALRTLDRCVGVVSVADVLAHVAGVARRGCAGSGSGVLLGQEQVGAGLF
ncbi:hypothetical protein AMAG_08588 [Allomyces macrogynus ATCC 38327]|uniref:CBS domain-containing protein n=1 Tax=Allomyces macrogynus (strain ATCC 38327) TaxID=578462 RepID=A0A0L0SLT8_ALLM3|nr:hypothetical protein AMAG_08588 [Allomyces macrogynus ATCC 38327]|eukprot:KNE63462.1 hypothetical protein AMAG_08588 [Allomyces macrogynus ATCC 38327]